MNMEPDECPADTQETIGAAAENKPPAYLLVEFKGHRRNWFPNPGNVETAEGRYVIIEADRGEDAGIVRASRATSPESPSLQTLNVLRAATEPDLERIERHRGWEHDALLTCSKKIAAHHLPMHLVDAEFRFDELKLTFYFTAEGRVDFRELVRDLAGAFRTRIELRQIGARDELKRSEGYGVCGQRLCCVNFLCSFQPITTAMAKSQHLILNPIKLSGCCGRLKCCLAFEAENYVGDDGCPCTLQLPSVIDPDARIDHLSD